MVQRKDRVNETGGWNRLRRSHNLKNAVSHLSYLHTYTCYFRSINIVDFTYSQCTVSTRMMHSCRTLLTLCGCHFGYVVEGTTRNVRHSLTYLHFYILILAGRCWCWGATWLHFGKAVKCCNHNFCSVQTDYFYTRKYLVYKVHNTELY